MTQPFITVIVPVRNEERFLSATLHPLLFQEYRSDRYEILVVDGQSTDNTVAVVRRLQSEFPQLQLHYNPRRLSSAARNIGIRRARGDFVVIVDGHCELRNRHYLRDLACAFQQTGADCLGRSQPLDVQTASPLQRTIALARASRLGHNPGSHIYSDRGGYVKPQSVAVAYRKSVFETIGLFDERFDACEDVEFNHRVDAAGLKCYLAPELTVHYQPRNSLTGLAWQMQRYGRGRARLLIKHPETLSLPPLVPALFLVGLLTAFLLGLVTPLFAAAFCLAVLIYGAGLCGFAVWLSARGRAAELSPLFPAVFLAIHVGAGWGVLAEFMPRWVRNVLRIVYRLSRGFVPVGGAIPSWKSIERWQSTSSRTLSSPSPQTIPLHRPRTAGARHALTIDVEEYFHVHAFANVIDPTCWDEYPSRVVESTQLILDLLAERSVQATFFVLGWVARRQPELVRAIRAGGHEIASHGYYHQRVDSLSAEQFRIDVRLAKRVLEETTGQSVKAYRAPSFSITPQTPWAMQILVEEGYTVDSSLASGRGTRSTEPESPARPYVIDTSAGALTEFPMPSSRFLGKRIPVGGGGYLRLFPYWSTKRQLRAIEADGNSFCVYIHPWEFDLGQPRLSAPWRQNVRHRIGTATMAGKLRQLLADFQFSTIDSLLSNETSTRIAAAA